MNTTSSLTAALAVATLALAAALAPAPALADGAPKILKKVPPEFPAEATPQGHHRRRAQSQVVDRRQRRE
jgi:hypothetical protein